MGDSETSPTSDAQVDEALRALEALEDLPVHDHAAVFEGIHRALQDRLTGDEEPHDELPGAAGGAG